MRVVLDTNILVSAFLFEKRLGKITKLIEQGAVTPCFIVSTFHEFSNVLGYEKFASLFEATKITPAQIMEDLHNKSIILDDPRTIPSILPDNNPDNYILAAAVAGGADVMVTGDKQLLNLKEFQRIPIITAQRFLKSKI